MFLVVCLPTFISPASTEHEPEMTLDDWIALSDDERAKISRDWTPYDTSSIDTLLKGIAEEFRKAYPNLNIEGLGNVHGSLELVVAHPFVFDKRLIPGSFLGLEVKTSLSSPIPDDFEVFAGYIWAPENYANFVDTHTEEVRTALGNPNMNRAEMLHALIGMPFEDWVKQCRKLGPGYTKY
jgi:hypothetical protein